MRIAINNDDTMVTKLVISLAKRKAALIFNFIQGKTTVSKASRTFDLSPSEITNRDDEAKRVMENALKFKLC